MSDVVLICSALVSLLILVLLGIFLFKSRSDSEPTEPRENPRIINAAGNDHLRVGNRRVRQRHQRRHVDEDDNPEDEEDDPLADEIAMPDGKIGAKKRRKLEMKAEKRAAREREIEEREDRKRRQALLDEQRKAEEERIKEEEMRIAEEEKKAKEEKERQEYEEYLKLKESFAVEEEGFEEDAEESESQNKLQTFIDYIKENKVVLLEDLAGHFRMKTQDVINRVQDLLAQELLVGVIDDRGKFIYITKEELESVAKFIKRRGRVAISELVESSNSLIKLQPQISLDVKS
ncbi:hypothetical protein B4U80_07042 [Leptotrombidium deliense]|uniref:DDRGK domain-containing protein 1 n=1 Tax=Leptotrombidium deliense TaxID=299467 RepID=A0A443SV08_9ACAR|nr:hypothetical protein B4U80_07042 [Leptotrombidium deliense]